MFGCSELVDENDDAESLIDRADRVKYVQKLRMKSYRKSG